MWSMHEATRMKISVFPLLFWPRRMPVVEKLICVDFFSFFFVLIIIFMSPECWLEMGAMVPVMVVVMVAHRSLSNSQSWFAISSQSVPISYIYTHTHKIGFPSFIGLYTIDPSKPTACSRYQSLLLLSIRYNLFIFLVYLLYVYI